MSFFVIAANLFSSHTTKSVFQAFLKANAFELNEAELIKRCQAQNSKAQRELYEAFADRLYRLAYRYVKDPEEAEDVLIVAFDKIFKNISRFSYQGAGSLLAWMRKVVVNEALMTLRRHHNFNLTEALEPELAIPDLSGMQRLDAEHIYQLIVDLPDGYRTVFNLYEIEGYDHREIAEMLGIAESTSRTQLLKAKLLLRKKITSGGFRYGT